MTKSQDPSQKQIQAGGFFMAAGTLIGAIGGGFMGQPSAGMLLGLIGGGVIALVLWLRDRTTP